MYRTFSECYTKAKELLLTLKNTIYLIAPTPVVSRLVRTIHLEAGSPAPRRGLMDYNFQRSARHVAPIVRRGRVSRSLYKLLVGAHSPFLVALLLVSAVGNLSCCHPCPSSTKTTIRSLAASGPALAGAAPRSCGMLSTVQRSRALRPARPKVQKRTSAACAGRGAGARENRALLPPRPAQPCAPG